MTIRDSQEKPAQVFLPKSYIAIMMDDDIEKINTNPVSLYLFFRGVCEATKTNLLAMEM